MPNDTISAGLVRHTPSLLIAVVVALVSWFGRTVVQGNEDRAKLGTQLTEVASMVTEMRGDAKIQLGQVATLNAHIADIERRVGNVEAIMVYRSNEAMPAPYALSHPSAPTARVLP